ncbi:FMN-binding glutamate synthase family protein [Agriterribacter sp.]|uniref:FMN-binding glutamate synthase family protein n=1 Tax=Agriterribacter sp. TaxID=2821509 RepID=UPI002BC39F84|nr:FMN-binding glutamate synthase family protein [Agriterribacter sp.]HRO44914.1 FMN-binding glutamate synthase family protein [Agriterribacter sp.]HRQ15652.1 FMN-binding glutamate synthase family protein [Agriterribacter sp.]
MRKVFIITAFVSLLVTGLLSYAVSWWWLITFIIVVLLIIMGIYDMLQTRHSIMRNYPVVGRMRYWMEDIRPKMYQYFIESDIDGRPVNRIDRSTIYQRAKREMDTMPFGTQLNVYEEGYEWLSHSIAPKDFNSLNHDPRILIGNKDCKQPYSSSILNVSAMSFGSLSPNAIEALNGGAKIGGFAHNTGEGGISAYHLKQEGDLIWQIGTGYFGCRDEAGNFSAEVFKKNVNRPQIKMVELKLSQGAKPGHGGILPAKKNTLEIATIRHVQPFTTVASPPFHSAFSSPKGLILFIQQLREWSEGRPVGFKLCVGRKSEFAGICKAMVELDIYPDFITIDGGEGGTGAAPQEFSNYVGAPMMDGLAFVHNMLIGFGIRQHIKVIASGKILSGFHILRALALGADGCNSARAMMMAIGCIQALLCNTNRCPTGVATQNPQLTVGLVVKDKKYRVANYHEETVKSFVELCSAAGVGEKEQLTRSHIYRRVFMNEVRTFEDIFPSLQPGCLLNGNIPEKYKQDIEAASADRW